MSKKAAVAALVKPTWSYECWIDAQAILVEAEVSRLHRAGHMSCAVYVVPREGAVEGRLLVSATAAAQ